MAMQVRPYYTCVYTKIWEEERGNSKLPILCHQGIDCIRIDISWSRCGTRIGYFMDDVSRQHRQTTYG